MTQSDTFKENPIPRKLTAVTVPAGMGGVLKLASVIGPALAGTGPAILPMAAEPEFLVRQMRNALKSDDQNFPLESSGVVIVCATSGSTGSPRGVLLKESALAAAASAVGSRF